MPYNVTTNCPPGNVLDSSAGKYFRTDYGRLEIQTEVLDSSSGQSVGSYLLKDSFSTKEAIVNEKGGDPDKSRFLAMANTIGQTFADNLISAVFPMKVIGLSNGQIYINRGAEGGLAKGDVLDVFRVGDELVWTRTPASRSASSKIAWAISRSSRSSRRSRLPNRSR